MIQGLFLWTLFCMGTKAMLIKSVTRSSESYAPRCQIFLAILVLLFDFISGSTVWADSEAPHLPEITLNHENNKTLNLKPLYLSTVVKTVSGKDIEAEP